MEEYVIKKIIAQYGEPCPNFKYENPLLDKNIADLVSKGFIKLLKKHDSKRSVLENIRKSCKVEPSYHLCIDDNVTEILRNAYEELPNECNINKILDSFLVRNLKETDINSVHSSHLKPDIIRALVNLNGDKQEINDILLKDIIYWKIDHSNENSYLDILKSMWNVECVNGFKEQPDDISIKIKPWIEKIILPSVLEMLDTIILEDDWFLDNKELNRLIIISSISKECFQICSSIMNTLFIKTNFDMQMHKFITLFIDAIKFKVQYISQLYPYRLQHIVMLLDIDLTNLEGDVKTTYITHTLEHLQLLHKECESDVIMLLSHFNQWFNLYHDNRLK